MKYGLFFNYCTMPNEIGQLQPCFFALSINECTANDSIRTNGTMRFEFIRLARDNRGTLAAHYFQIASVTLDKIDRLAGPWRKVSVSVIDNVIVAKWKQLDDANWKDIVHAKMDYATDKISITSINGAGNDQVQGSQIINTRWTTPCSIGIWSYNSGIGIRNLLISPIPHPGA